LLDILYDPNIEKVFHAAGQDLEIFNHLWRRPPSPVFDTQLAATLLGLGEQLGYGKLVKQLLGKDLEKDHTRADWSLRPLAPEFLRYALDDVIYLGEVYQRVRGRLQDLGREDWLREDFALLADPATYVADPPAAWKKIKGRQKLKGNQLAILQALAEWRETEAQRVNRPKRWLLRDEVMLDLARHQPRSKDQLQRIRGLEGGTVKRRGEALLQLIELARQLPPEQWPQENRGPPRLSLNQEALTDLLMCSLRLLAETNAISPTALGNRKELERLVSGERELEILRGWRKSLAGEHLLQVLAGKTAPRIDRGRLALSAV
jgi:ribonuclease D